MEAAATAATAATGAEECFIDDSEEALKAVNSTDYYDETLDDEDESWATKQRQGRKSDAILSCPACFTTLCIECQRHEKYVHQYRAMFVCNCKIVENERLRLPGHRLAKKTRKSRKNLLLVTAMCRTCSRKSQASPKTSFSKVYAVQSVTRR